MKRALVVNLAAGSGAGKSTNASRLFTMLKDLGHEVELVSEFAKDLVWEERHKAFRCQAYIFGKQLHRLQRVADSVDIIITDSPLFLSAIYDPEQDPDFRNFVLTKFRSFNTLNVYLTRVKPFNPVGRMEATLEEAQANDQKVLAFLTQHQIEFMTADGDAQGCQEILEVILAKGGR